MDFRDYIIGAARLAALQVLLGSPQYQANDSVLHSALHNSLGLPLTRDQLLTELNWLEEQGLVRLTAIAQNMVLVSITTRGIDVAQGIAIIPGVDRPQPEV